MDFGVDEDDGVDVVDDKGDGDDEDNEESEPAVSETLTANVSNFGTSSSLNFGITISTTTIGRINRIRITTQRVLESLSRI